MDRDSTGPEPGVYGSVWPADWPCTTHLDCRTKRLSANDLLNLHELLLSFSLYSGGVAKIHLWNSTLYKHRTKKKSPYSKMLML